MSTIAAGTTSTTGLVQTSDTTGNLVLQVNGTTPSLTLNTAGAHGVGASPSYGTTGQFLTSQGSAASPTWTTPSSGAMTLISTQTASSSANIIWTGLTLDKYILIVSNFLPSTTANLLAQVGYGATPTYYTSGYYYAGYVLDTNNVPANDASNTSSYMQLSQTISSTSNLYGGTGNFTFAGFNSNNYACGSMGTMGGYDGGSQSGSGTYTSKSKNIGNQITALKIYPSAGTIISGTFSLYSISS